MAAAITNGVEVVAHPDQRHPHLADVEPPRLPRREVVAAAKHHPLSHTHLVVSHRLRPPSAAASRVPSSRRSGATTARTGERSTMSSKKPWTINPSARSGGTPRDSR